MSCGRRVAGLEGGGEPDGEHDQAEAHAVVPSDFFLQHEPGNQREDDKRDAFLDDF